MARREIAVEVGLAGAVDGATLPAQPARVERQIAPVGRQGVSRQPFLEPQGVDEGVDGSVAAGQERCL